MFWVSGRSTECAGALSFNEDVLPILTAKCFLCHGPDPSSREADLRLDQESGIKSAAEELIVRITSSDPDDRMPPPESGRVLTAVEIDTLSQWVSSGAVWEQHWSLVPLTRPSVPVVERSASNWTRNPIDRFIAAKQAEIHLSHSEDADALTLIRRLTYDLTGLPPTPEEVAAFAVSAEEDLDAAMRAAAERLLAIPQYGERWARHWLDVVKYADTCGYDKDKLRPNAWPYRDYVIRSFNEDKPYARFVEEQLAGDVLHPGTADGILGLGFVAAGPWDFIGHVEVAESKIDGQIARHTDRDEMVSNTMNTFVSATVQCARCHDHKFDPFTREQYYGLQAVFAAVDRAERPYDLPPEVTSRRRALQKRLELLKEDRRALEAEIKEAGGAGLAEIQERIESLAKEVGPVTQSSAYGYHSAIARSADEVKWMQVDLGDVRTLKEIVLRPCHDDFAGIGGGFGFPVRFRVEASMEPAFAPSITIVDHTGSDFPNPDISPVVLPVTGGARFIRVTATRLAERENDFILALAEIEATGPDGRNVALGAKVTALDSIEAPARWSRSNLTDGEYPEPEDADSYVLIRDAERQRDEVLSEVMTPERRRRREEIASALENAEKALEELPTGKMVHAAATHFKSEGNFKPTEGVPREIRVLHRGDVQSPGVEAHPGALSVFDGEPARFRLPGEHSESDRRAALAEWITRDDNPLTWRSIVNRVWLWHFGQGLVRTPNDFGRMGQPPSHPELLDWLACEFRDSGGSMKHLHRLITSSATYRQAASDHRIHARIDSDNRYLWRMNRRRLEAEELRDSMLSVSGTLDKTMGGPGFMLFALEKTDHSPHYEYHKFDPADPASHRRSIYRFIVRSQPDPFMTTLDCADSNQSTPVREETLTSLQALGLLNNPFTLHMATKFAERLDREADDLEARVALGHELVTGRRPTVMESALLVEYARTHGLPNLCRVLFNLSEFVYLD